jgi:hypothetical protein
MHKLVVNDNCFEGRKARSRIVEAVKQMRELCQLAQNDASASGVEISTPLPAEKTKLYDEDTEGVYYLLLS